MRSYLRSRSRREAPLVGTWAATLLCRSRMAHTGFPVPHCSPSSLCPICNISYNAECNIPRPQPGCRRTRRKTNRSWWSRRTQQWTVASLVLRENWTNGIKKGITNDGVSWPEGEGMPVFWHIKLKWAIVMSVEMHSRSCLNTCNERATKRTRNMSKVQQGQYDASALYSTVSTPAVDFYHPERWTDFRRSKKKISVYWKYCELTMYSLN